MYRTAFFFNQQCSLCESEAAATRCSLYESEAAATSMFSVRKRSQQQQLRKAKSKIQGRFEEYLNKIG